jgi:sugar phosphate isomerase/epimerase
LKSCESPRLRAAFDPANFVQCAVRPMNDAYPLLEKYIAYIHVKDAIMESGKVVPAGQGDGQLRELIAALKTRQYSGFMSLEPHLKAAETFQGFSGPELFVTAVRALKQLLNEADIPWN